MNNQSPFFNKDKSEHNAATASLSSVFNLPFSRLLPLSSAHTCRNLPSLISSLLNYVLAGYLLTCLSQNRLYLCVFTVILPVCTRKVCYQILLIHKAHLKQTTCRLRLYI